MPFGAALNPLPQRSMIRLRGAESAFTEALRFAFLDGGFASLPAFNAAVTDAMRGISDVTALSRGRRSLVGYYSQSDGPAGPLGAGFDGQPGGSLTLDPELLENALEALHFVQGSEARLRDGLVAFPMGTARVVLVVLLPAPSSRDPLVRLVRHGDPWVAGDATAAPADYRLILAEEGAPVALAALREMGTALRLAPEWTVPASAADGAAWDRPASGAAARPLLGPNLVYRSGSELHYDARLELLADPDFPGFATAGELSDPAASGGQNAITELIEGGAGYRHDVFRTARDCIMRRRFASEFTGTGTDPDALEGAPADLDFCAACTEALDRALAYRPVPQRRFDGQKTHFTRIEWTNGGSGESFQDAFGTLEPQRSVTGYPGQGTQHYWGYGMSVDRSLGLRFTDLVALRASEAGARPIADSLGFRDFCVSYTSGAGSVVRRPFTLDAAFDGGTVEAFHGHGGRLGQDWLWQEGYLLRATVEIDGLLEVTVEQSVCLRTATNDFDPTKAVVAIKAYPELAFSYRPLADDVTVDAFHGAVHQVVRPTSTPMMQHGGSDPTPDPEQDTVYTSWFSEINGLVNAEEIPFRLRGGVVGALRSAWENAPTAAFYAALFAYWQKQELAAATHDLAGQPLPAGGARGVTEMEVVGVRHPDQARPWWNKRAMYNAPGFTNGKIKLWRETREGQYDNVHTHGWMGPAINPPATTPAPGAEPLRMAPVCGQACVHIHWRWLFGAGEGNWAVSADGTISPDYWGWGDDPVSAQSNERVATPLAPPNQRVRVAITNPDTERGGGGPGTNDPSLPSVLPGTDLIHGVRIADPARPLDPDARALWYDVDIEGHIAPETLHVILEQGWGFALDHAEVDVANNVPYQPFTIQWLRNTANVYGYDGAAPGNDHETDPIEKVMMFVYGGWTFYEDGTEQLPTGDWIDPNMPFPAMEAF